MIHRFLNSKTKTVTFSAFLLAVSSLISEIFGLLRNNLLATSFPRTETDIYFAAFKLPDFVYGVLITGGIVAAFLPVFSLYFKKSKAEAEVLTNNILTLFLIALSALSALLAFFAPQLAKFVVPGFSQEDQSQTVQLMRIMFLSPVLLGMSAIFSGILQYFNLFFAYCLAPIFYNLGIIFGILFFYPVWGLEGLAWGVILGAFLHLLIQLPAVFKAGFRFRFVFDIKHSGLKRLFKLMVPRALGSAAHHINLIVITALASTISAGAISIFNYANYLYGVPVSLIGISFATAAFPTLSKNFANGEKKDFLRNFSSVFSQILFFIIPLTVLIFLLRAQLTRLLFGTSLTGHGYFGWWETRLTAALVGIFAISLFSASLIPFLARAFFSLQDTKTPVKIAVLTIGLNIALSFIFVWLLKSSSFFQKGMTDFLKLQGIKNISVAGLPLALTISSIFQFFLMIFFLKKKVKGLNFKIILLAFLRFLLASVLIIPVVWLGLRLWAYYFATSTVFGVFLQIILSGFLGILIYIPLTFLFGSKEPKIIWVSIKKQFKK